MPTLQGKPPLSPHTGLTGNLGTARVIGDATHTAYECWAATYESVPHNPFMAAEQSAMLEHWPEVSGRRVLDLACGTGRYANLLRAGGADQVIAMDFSMAMLRRVVGVGRVQADMMKLPFKTATFEVAISGLALGHAGSVASWMQEIARVSADHGLLLYSDFHPQAINAGMTRSFKDEFGRTHAVPHSCYTVAEQRAAAVAAGFSIEAVHELRVGYEFQERYPGCEALYRDWHGVPLILIVRARRQQRRLR